MVATNLLAIVTELLVLNKGAKDQQTVGELLLF